MARPGCTSYDSSTEDRNSNSTDIIKCSQGFRSEGKFQEDRFQQVCAEGMSMERRYWRDQRSRETATTVEAKDLLFIYQYYDRVFI